MVSPSKTKLSNAGQQQQQHQQEQQQQRHSTNLATQKKSGNKVQLVKGPKPLVHHRFYLDVEQHQVATKIETTIKDLGGSIEFFLNKDITHFITDKHQQSGQFSTTAAAAETGERKEQPSPSVVVATSSVESLSSTRRRPSSVAPPAATTSHHRRSQQHEPLSSRHLLHLKHQQQTSGQYVNDYGPATSRTSSPCPPPATTSTTAPSSSAAACITTAGAASVQEAAAEAASSTATSAGFDGKVKSTQPSASCLPTAAGPRSRADAMLQRVRQQQQQQHQYQQPPYHLLHSSPLNSPAAAAGLAYGSTPTKVGTPPSFHSPSSHKYLPGSPCYSPAGGPARAPPSHQNSPIQIARSWGTLIWSAEYALKFLRKVLGSLPRENGTKSSRVGTAGTVGASGHRQHRHHRHHHHQSQHVHHLRGSFIKVECRSAPGNYRPFYQEFKQWPVLLRNPKDLIGKKAPFADANEPPQRKEQDRAVAGRKTTAGAEATPGKEVECSGTARMTRKLSITATATARTAAATTTTGKSGESVLKKRQQPSEKPPPRDCGYCEICRIEYDSLEVHLQSESHQAFVRNNDNFLSLDRLLGSIGAGGNDGGLVLAADCDAKGAVAADATTTVRNSLGSFFQQLQQDTAGSVEGSRERKVAAIEHQEENKQEQREDDGQQRKTSSTTVTVAVTTTTTAAADELIDEQEDTRIGAIKPTQGVKKQYEPERVAKTANSGRENSPSVGKRKRATNSESSVENEGLSGDRSDGVGNDSHKEFVKQAIELVKASFDHSSSSDFLVNGDTTQDDPVVPGYGSDGDEAHVPCTPEEQLTGDDPRRIIGKRDGRDSDTRAANINSVVGDRGKCLTVEEGSPVEEETECTRTRKDRSCKTPRQAVGSSARGERRSSRTSTVIATTASLVETRSVEQREESGGGMFGRRSAIHHHPHNQLNHHNHQKHKSTLSALLLKQQREREQEQDKPLSQPADGCRERWEDEKPAEKDCAADDAAGMKVITDFRKEPAEDDLVADKSFVLVVPTVAASTDSVAPTANLKPSPGANRRKRRGGLSEAQEKEPAAEAAMGLKQSTIAMNKHHHHHHHHHHHQLHHMNDVSGGAGGTKTRHATEVAASLLECDGLDPKNTKRISLGLRQNPKRANLNEDFTSLLDETLERSKTSSSTTSSAKRVQSRIRQQPKQAAKLAAKEEDEQLLRGCDEEKEKDEQNRLKPTSKRPGPVGKKATISLEDIKVRGIRWRAPSPTTRPPVKSPLLYKVIDQGGEEIASSGSAGVESGDHDADERNTSSSRPMTASSLALSPRKDAPPTAQERSSKSSPKAACATMTKKNGLIVKIRRVRQSELSLLNDEAENFMFPRKDDSSSDADTDDDRQTSSEGFRGTAYGSNNYSIDLRSSSEGDRATTAREEHAEDDEEPEVHEDDDPKQRRAAIVGGRKRKKPIPASSDRAPSMEDSSDRLSSPSSLSSTPLPSGTVMSLSKRPRLETACSRRKGQLTADYDKSQDPAESRTRFPEAPIQPGSVAGATAASSSSSRRRRSPSVVPGEEDRPAVADDDQQDVDDDDEDESEHEVRRGVRREMRGRGAGRGRGRQRKVDPVETATGGSRCTGACRGFSGSVRGRGRGGAVGRRGRRGRGRGGRLLHATGPSGAGACTCHLLDASRMPPPASRRRANDSDECDASSVPSCGVATPPTQRKAGTRASKTKTTPPGGGGQDAESSSVSGPSLASGGGIIGSYSKGKEDGMGAVFKWINFRKRCEEIEPYRFAFERVPSLEPWYETFQRQDDGTEKVYEYFGSTGYRKLPYEMGPLPALGQNCCILNYKMVASRKSNRTASLQSSSSASMEPSSPGGGKRGNSRQSTVEHFGGSSSPGKSAGTVGDGEAKKCSPSSSLSSLPLKKRKLLMQEAGSLGSSPIVDGGISGERSSHSNRIARLIAGGNERPRKSPREHASTLAILSLLQQQQLRKRAGTIKILTSPKKVTTATATQTTALHELLQQDADSNGEDLSRSCSRTSDPGGSRAGSANGAIKFEKPLFPDSSYVNSRTLCQELDAFLTDELRRVAGPKFTDYAPPAVVKKEQSEIPEVEEETDDPKAEWNLLAAGSASDAPAKHEELSLDAEVPLDEDEELVLPPSVVREGIAIERDELPISKRDLLDVLQTVGSEPPLSLKLVQRCESVVKKIVQYDRKQRSMLVTGAGAGLAISSSSPVIGLQLFDSGAGLAACGAACGPGSIGVGGSFLKKRINRTGWPTNKRKIGTRTRQQSRFMMPSTMKKSLSRESVKKEHQPEEDEEDSTKTADDGLPERAVEQLHDEEVDDDEEEEDDDDEEEEEYEEVEEEDDADTIVDAKVPVRAVTGLCKDDMAPSAPKAGDITKTDDVRRNRKVAKLQEDPVTVKQINHVEGKSVERRRRKRSSVKSDEGLRTSFSAGEHTVEEDEDAKSVEQRIPKRETPAEDAAASSQRVPPTKESIVGVGRSIAFDSMPTLRAALMRDNSQLQRHVSSTLTFSSPASARNTVEPSERPAGSLCLRPSLLSPGMLNRGSGPASSVPGSGPMMGNKYVTKTTTTMTRVDYDGVSAMTTALPSVKRKSREERAASADEEDGEKVPPRAEVSRLEELPQSRTKANHRGVGAGTHEDDDKECDSISSRSIFVSDDCDTTSSSTAINPSDDRPPSTGELPSSALLSPCDPAKDMAKRLFACEQPEESSENEELPQEEEKHGPRGRVGRLPAVSKTPRTPSERIRNKMVKNRRVTLRMGGLTVATKAKGVAASGKQPNNPRDDHTDVPSRRRKSSSLGPPLPPASMMPLSPPLTTSTSSSSSSCYGADDKPMSPAAVTAPRRKLEGLGNVEDDEEEDEELDIDRQQHLGGRQPHGKGQHVGDLTPSKIKTRSSTCASVPAVKRTYEAAKLSTKIIPYVSLVKTTFLPTETIVSSSPTVAAFAVNSIDKKPTIAGSNDNSSSSSTSNRNRRRKQVVKKMATSLAAIESTIRLSPVKSVLKKGLAHPKHRTAGLALKQKGRDSESSNKAQRSHTTVASVGVRGNKKLAGKSQSKRPPKNGDGVFNNNSATAQRDVMFEKEEHDPMEQKERKRADSTGHASEVRFLASKHVGSLIEEHLIEEEEEDHLMAREEDEEDATVAEEEEEHFEILELMEVEEDDEMVDEQEGAKSSEEPEEEDEDDAFLTGEEETEHECRDDEERKLMMADHDYSDQHVDPNMADAEFVEVEEVEEDDLEDGEEDEDEDVEEEEEEEEEHDDEHEDDGDDGGHPLQQQRLSTAAVGFPKQNVKLTFPPKMAPTATATTSNSSATTPTKYSPRKLRKPRGRWYRER